jgi:hypothetical protein
LHVCDNLGEDVIFRINTSAEARKRRRNTNGDETELTIDTTDVTVNGVNVPFFTIHFVERFCEA